MASKPGIYQLTGYDPERSTINDHLDRITQRVIYPMVYRNNQKYTDQETYLIHSKPTNLRYINQLMTRPYLGCYCGVGTASMDNKDLESFLQQGILSNPRIKACQSVTMKEINRFIPLPEYGNPQRVEHIIPPPPHLGGWVRGGAHTRDLVRRVDHLRRCQNQIIYNK
ncbi:MAG: hypothetical protein ABIN35_00510 [candidate division WOR-3 bacterium]